ncbi:MAG TPA: response regulator [Terriglobia bacterium]|nr:response regulator [Terriglobia bacterium]
MTRTILVADDSPTIQRQASGLLIAEGMEVVSVSNGVAAIKKLPTVKPHLILADVSMPGKDGYEVCEFVKHSTELCHIPVLLTCSEFEPYHEDRGTEVQADGCVKKPFNQYNLIAAVTKCLTQSELAQPAPFFPAPPPAGFESIPSAGLAGKTAAAEAQPEFDLTALSEGVALTDPLGESPPGIPAQERQEETSGPDSQMFQSEGGNEPAMAQGVPSVSKETNGGAEESDELSASSGPVESEDFSDSEPAPSGASTIFLTSEQTAGQSTHDAAVQIPEHKDEPEVRLPEIAFPSMPPVDVANLQQAYVPAVATSEQPGMTRPGIFAEPELSRQEPEAAPAVEESPQDSVPETAQPTFVADGTQCAPVSGAEESKDIPGFPQPPEPQVPATLQAEFVEYELEGDREPSLVEDEIKHRAGKAEQPDPEMICTIVRKVVLKMSPPALGPEVLEDIVRRITSELTAEFDCHTS